MFPFCQSHFTVSPPCSRALPAPEVGRLCRCRNCRSASALVHLIAYALRRYCHGCLHGLRQPFQGGYSMRL
jgi:hypothetical protein